MPTYLTLDEAAESLNCSKRHLRRLIADGRLRAYAVGTTRVLRIDPDDLHEVMTEVVPSGRR